MFITDFHTHAFPDSLAAHAIAVLSAGTPEARPRRGGTIGDLLTSMDRAGIDRSVICSIATRPEQFGKILQWSLSIASKRLIPLVSVHPADPDAIANICRIKATGLRGIKLHPYYQDFVLDDPAMFPIYRAISDNNLILVCHTGFDVAFPHIRRCDPVRIANLLDRFPDLKFVATHLGAWRDWDEVEKHLLGKNIYIEISFSLGCAGDEQVRRILTGHPANRLLFGSDSPWQDQSETLEGLRHLRLDPGLNEAILAGNAATILGL
jgi:predicted TIM-barrel fold metal-dependent hydrolase